MALLQRNLHEGLLKIATLPSVGKYVIEGYPGKDEVWAMFTSSEGELKAPPELGSTPTHLSMGESIRTEPPEGRVTPRGLGVAQCEDNDLLSPSGMEPTDDVPNVKSSVFQDYFERATRLQPEEEDKEVSPGGDGQHQTTSAYRKLFAWEVDDEMGSGLGNGLGSGGSQGGRSNLSSEYDQDSLRGMLARIIALEGKLKAVARHDRLWDASRTIKSLRPKLIMNAAERAAAKLFIAESSYVAFVLLGDY